MKNERKYTDRAKRNPSIELFRYVFAFLVVVIHVPLAHGVTVLMPLARCAVPFFYLVSGYFLAKKICRNGGAECLRSARKWIGMWGKYIAVFAILGVLVDWHCGSLSLPETNDIKILVLKGECPYIDEHIVCSRKLGILTLWFLYDGALAFGLLYLLHKYLYSKVLLFMIVALQLVLAVCLREKIGSWLNLFYASVPYLYYGLCLGKSDVLENTVRSKCSYVTVLAVACVLYICGLVEYKVMGDEQFVNIPLSICLFLLVMSCRTDKVINRFTPPYGSTPCRSQVLVRWTFTSGTVSYMY